MPIYDVQCEDCGNIEEVLLKKYEDINNLECFKCKGTKMNAIKSFSGVFIGMSTPGNPSTKGKK